MKILGMDYTSLLARVVSVMTEKAGGAVAVKLAEIRRLQTNSRLSFSLNEDENVITITTVEPNVEEAPLFALLPVEPIATRNPVNRVVRHSPDEVAQLLFQKQREMDSRVREDTAPLTGLEGIAGGR